MTEDEECVLGDMISFFNDMGLIDDPPKKHMTYFVRNTANLVLLTTNQLIHLLEKLMSTLHQEEILWNIYYEVVAEFPYMTEEQHIESANKRFDEVCQ